MPKNANVVRVMFSIVFDNSPIVIIDKPTQPTFNASASCAIWFLASWHLVSSTLRWSCKMEKHGTWWSKSGLLSFENLQILSPHVKHDPGAQPLRTQQKSFPILGEPQLQTR
jgi:hypothetical protein